MREIAVTLVERDLTGWQVTVGWVETCKLLGGLRKLKLGIDSVLCCSGENLLSVDTPWVAEGVLKLKALRRLEIIIRDMNAEQSLLDDFQEDLQEQMRKGVDVLVRKRQTR